MSIADSTPDSILPVTRASAIAAHLRGMIRSAEIPPGTHLRQAQIAEQFGVSTTPVREAFIVLAREGFVRQDAHRGVVVFAPSTEEIAEIYEMRVVLEPLATELAAKRLTAEDIARLEGIVKEMREAEPRRYVELNRDFHGIIYSAANRPRLIEIVDGLREAAAYYVSLNVFRYDEEYRRQVQAEHESILSLLRSGTPKQAGRAIREHLENNARHVKELIELTVKPLAG